MHIIYNIIGFITFKSRRAQVTAAQIPILSQKYPTVTAISAPARSDIIWDNMSISTIHTENAAYLTAIFYYTGKFYVGFIHIILGLMIVSCMQVWFLYCIMGFIHILINILWV